MSNKKNLTLDLTFVEKFLGQNYLQPITAELKDAQDKILHASGAGSDFLGWVNLPTNYDRQEFADIKAAAAKIRAQSQAVVVIGIGGSYLGARAALEALRSPNYNLLPKKSPDIYFAGNNLSAKTFVEIKTLLGKRDFSLIVISKSGTTTEPAVAFRLFRQLLIDKYGRAASSERIYAITDRQRGVLKDMSTHEHYQTFVVPDDVGGRYSVLTPVGLLPLAAAGLDIEQLLLGARAAQTELASSDIHNQAWQYAGGRQLLARQNKVTEVLSYYEPNFKMLAEWWKQLFGESEGKDEKGIFPASVEFTTDLHSLGQYLQAGQRNLIETVLWLDQKTENCDLPADPDNLDQLNFLSGKSLNYINEQAFLATVDAHVSGGVPNFIFHLSKMDEFHLGYLFYFFEFSCALSAYLSGVNPFDQPGVEVYKKNMFQRLGKK